jgi:hypothetical protein
MINIFLYLYFLFASGTPLGIVKRDYCFYVEELSHKHSSSPIFLQTNFISTVDQLMILPATSENSTLPLPKSNALDFNAPMIMILSIVNGDYQEAVDVGRLFFKQFPIEIFDYVSYYMLVGVANIALYKRTGKTRK